MFYKILSQSAGTAVLSISKESKIADLYKDGAVITLFAGGNSKKVKISISDELEKDVIKTSTDVLSALYIRQDISYQLVCTNKRIRIGPVIGLLLFTKKSSMTSKALKRQLDYSLLYNNIKGLLYVFSVEGIDFETNTVNGFCYSPAEHCWDEGTFPFPDVIYRRVSMPEKTIEALGRATKNRMYNSYHFNKLDFWKLASSSEQISEYLPETRVYSSVNDIDEMLEKHKVLFLKPVDSTRAFGLMRITKGENAYSIQEKMAEKPEPCTSSEEIARYIETYRRGERYLIQEGVDLLNVDNRYADFRVIMQKDHLMEWQCTGIIASIGKTGGVCSNYSVDDKYMTYEVFFDEYFTTAKEEVFKKKQEIIGLCKKACRVLDESGKNYADLGVDVGLDKNLKPWLFEMNNRRHSHELALKANDYDTYFRAKTNPVRYGARLGGFDAL